MGISIYNVIEKDGGYALRDVAECLQPKGDPMGNGLDQFDRAGLTALPLTIDESAPPIFVVRRADGLVAATFDRIDDARLFVAALKAVDIAQRRDLSPRKMQFTDAWFCTRGDGRYYMDRFVPAGANDIISAIVAAENFSDPAPVHEVIEPGT